MRRSISQREKYFDEVMKQLIGLQAVAIMHSGRLRFVRDFENYESTGAYDFAFLIQSPWRVTHRGSLIYGYLDSGEPQTYRDRDQIRPAVRVPMLRFLDKLLCGRLRVERVFLKNKHDLCIQLNAGYKFEVFAGSNRNSELWSLFDKNSENSWCYQIEDGLVTFKEMVLPPNDTAVEARAEWNTGSERSPKEPLGQSRS